MKLRAIVDPLPLYSRINAPAPFRFDPQRSAQGMDCYATSVDGSWLLVFTRPHLDMHLWVRREHVTAVDTPPIRPPSECRFGLHMRADGRNQPSDITLARAARIEAAKLMSTAAPEDVDALRTINSAMLIVVRMMADFRGRVVSADDFCSWMIGDLRPFYERGVRLFEVHNEPNLRAEGMWTSWQNGRDFAAWFLRVAQNLNYTFPQMQFVFPGLSPNNIITAGDQRYDDLRFLSEAETAWRAAEAIGVHCYWRTAAEMLHSSGGMYWQEYRRRVHGKPMFITEYSNPSSTVSGKEKGRQYLMYYETVRAAALPPRALFGFVASASDGLFAGEAWRKEDGTLAEIGEVVVDGRR